MYKWEVVSWLVNSGFLLCNLTTFPFTLEAEGKGMYVFIHLAVTLLFIRPMILSELLAGQLNQNGAFKTWGHMVPWLKGIGYISVVVSICALGNGSFVTSLGAFYFGNSFLHPMPWENTNASMEESNTTSSFYRTVAFPYDTKFTFENWLPHLHLSLCMLVIWVAVLLLNYACDRPSLRPYVAGLLTITPYLVLGLLFLGSLYNGARVYTDDFKLPSCEILLRPKFWISSVTQCFLYQPLGIGTATRIASLCDIHTDISMIGTCVILLGFFTERVVGMFLNTILQDHAIRTGFEIQKFQKNGPVLAFVTLPDYFSRLDSFPQVLTILYFTLIAILCISRTLVLFRGLRGALLEVCPKVPTLVAIGIPCIVGYMCGLPFLTPLSKKMAHFFTTFGINLMKVIIVLTISIGIHFYGVNSWKLDLEFIIQDSVSFFTTMSWAFFVVPVLTCTTLIIIISIFVEFFSYNHANPPHWMVGTGPLLLITAVLSLILMAVPRLVSEYAPTCWKKYKSEEAWGPKNPEEREEWKSFKKQEATTESIEMHEVNEFVEDT